MKEGASIKEQVPVPSASFRHVSRRLLLLEETSCRFRADIAKRGQFCLVVSVCPTSLGEEIASLPFIFCTKADLFSGTSMRRGIF